MKNKVLALGCYMAAAVLFLYYVYVLLSSAQTDVSMEYRMFYIDDQLAYYLEDGGLEAYGVNVDFPYVSDGMYRNQGKGWGSITEEGTWTSGPESYVYFYMDAEPKDNVSYSLKISTDGSICKPVTVFVNAVKAGKREAGVDGMYDICIPADCLRVGINEMRLKTDADEIQGDILVKAVALKKREKKQQFGLSERL